MFWTSRPVNGLIAHVYVGAFNVDHLWVTSWAQLLSLAYYISALGDGTDWKRADLLMYIAMSMYR